MAIINTFDKCLDSPYLWRDGAAPSRVVGLIVQADDSLGAARELLASTKPDATDVGILAYQAMFACVRALVYACGYREAGLKCLILACDALYVRVGRLDGQHLIAFEQVQGFKRSPEAAVAAATKLVAVTRELVGESEGKLGRP